jgi:hypothetical protein
MLFLPLPSSLFSSLLSFSVFLISLPLIQISVKTKIKCAATLNRKSADQKGKLNMLVCRLCGIRRWKGREKEERGRREEGGESGRGGEGEGEASRQFYFVFNCVC